MTMQHDAKFLNETISETTDRLMAERKLDFEAASNEAFKLHSSASYISEAHPQLAKQVQLRDDKRGEHLAGGVRLQLADHAGKTLNGVAVFDDTMSATIAVGKVLGLPFDEAQEQLRLLRNSGDVLIGESVVDGIRALEEQRRDEARSTAWGQRGDVTLGDVLHREPTKLDELAAAQRAVERLHGDGHLGLLLVPDAKGDQRIDPRIHHEDVPSTAVRLMGQDKTLTFEESQQLAWTLHTAAMPSRPR